MSAPFRFLETDQLVAFAAGHGIALTGEEPVEILRQVEELAIEEIAAEEGFGLVVEPEDLVGAFDEPFQAPRRRSRRKPSLANGHIHLPSIHIRWGEERRAGFDYEEDIYVEKAGSGRTVKRFITMTVLDGAGDVSFTRRTSDVLCPEEQADLEESLDLLTETDVLGDVDPVAKEEMEKRARFEYERQMRIIAGVEKACQVCWCSETRACSGGCIWAKPTICSRCWKDGVR
jgi:hypothetical protein